jgi:hypothetical protein
MAPLPHDPAEADGHDPLTCGVLGPEDPCPACRAAAAVEAERGQVAGGLGRAAAGLRADLLRIAAGCAEAEGRAWRAAVAGDAGQLEAAEAERQEAAGLFWAVSQDLADLLLLLLRKAAEHRGGALCLYGLDLLAANPDALRTLGRLLREAEKGST